MNNFKFNQVEVFMVERRTGQVFKDRMWCKFTDIAKELGFTITKVKGNFITHKINCNKDDFNVLIDLTREQT